MSNMMVKTIHRDCFVFFHVTFRYLQPISKCEEIIECTRMKRRNFPSINGFDEKKSEAHKEKFS